MQKFLTSILIGCSLLAGSSQIAQAQILSNFTNSASSFVIIDQAITNLPVVKILTNKGQGSTAAMILTEKCKALQFKYAQILDREVEAISSISLFSFIDEWWHTRYRYGGTTKKGIDCSAFTRLLQTEVYGFELPRTAREQYAACEKIADEDMMEGDLVFFNTRGGVSHVGVYVGGGYFVHASSSTGITIDHLDNDYYKKRFISAGRLEEVQIIAPIDPCLAG